MNAFKKQLEWQYKRTVLRQFPASSKSGESSLPDFQSAECWPLSAARPLCTPLVDVEGLPLFRLLSTVAARRWNCSRSIDGVQPRRGWPRRGRISKENDLVEDHAGSSAFFIADDAVIKLQDMRIIRLLDTEKSNSSFQNFELLISINLYFLYPE